MVHAMQVVRMNPAEAVQTHLELEAVQSIGVHSGEEQVHEVTIERQRADNGVRRELF